MSGEINKTWTSGISSGSTCITHSVSHCAGDDGILDQEVVHVCNRLCGPELEAKLCVPTENSNCRRDSWKASVKVVASLFKTSMQTTASSKPINGYKRVSIRDSLTFTGVNAHHMNCSTEQQIHERQDIMARRLQLIHDVHKRWPNTTTANLWPYTI